ncbi:unnamed protein product [Arctia plantaginis]|uniref:Peptidoglycan recognition protein n=1 Tax=Arctia plantaginis TaxID=874455 RepID=A0A8S0Z1M3_ARCPL|nr:unnamed protein product [Arctia plantaginis]
MDQSTSCLEQASEMGLSNFGPEEIRFDNCSSEVCVPLRPHLKRMVAKQNVLKSSGIHIGAKYVSVKQNIEQIAVVHDLSFCQYICHEAKRTTKLERMICAAALFILIMVIVILIYFSINANIVPEDITTEASQDWFIGRKEWLAKELNTTEILHEAIPLVVISHTVSPACYTRFNCVAAVKSMQSYYLTEYKYDIPYNFLIGSDGGVYEGLGWNIVGSHTLGYNECTIGVAFIGDYREGLPSYSKITELQIQRVHQLLKEGVEHGYLHTHFKVLGAKDLRPTVSPGANVINEIEKWANYDHKNVFKGHTCNQILDFFQKKIVTSNTNP